MTKTGIPLWIRMCMFTSTSVMQPAAVSGSGCAGLQATPPAAVIQQQGRNVKLRMLCSVAAEGCQHLTTLVDDAAAVATRMHKV